MARDQSRRGPSRGQGRVARPGKRRCLLKGCSRWFQSDDHRRRYCSASCTAAARTWARRRAQESYRRSPKGRARRKEQCRSRRRREKEGSRRREMPKRGGPAVCEGHQREESCGFLCARPGCYERVECSGQSSRRRFCTPVCWRALRTVLEREARWRLRLLGTRAESKRRSFDRWTMSQEIGRTPRLHGLRKRGRAGGPRF